MAESLASPEIGQIPDAKKRYQAGVLKYAQMGYWQPDWSPSGRVPQPTASSSCGNLLLATVRSAAWTVFQISIVTVIGPTPPGTGVM